MNDVRTLALVSGVLAILTVATAVGCTSTPAPRLGSTVRPLTITPSVTAGSAERPTQMAGSSAPSRLSR